MNIPEIYQGLIAATHTPMHPDGSLNTDAVKPLADFLATQGVTGLFVNGSTGEGALLATGERRALAETWTEAAQGRLKVIVHVGLQAQVEAVELARHAREIQADAVSAVAPNYFRPGSIDALLDWCRPIAAAAAPLPFFFYHIPALTHVSLPMQAFLNAAREALPNFGGLKYTHEDLMEFRQCLRDAGNDQAVLFGRDEILLAALALGARGAIGSTYNYAAPVYHRVWQHFRQGNLDAARQAQDQAIAMVRLLHESRTLAASKAFCGWAAGLDLGPVRSPLPNLSPAERTSLKTKWEAWAATALAGG